MAAELPPIVSTEWLLEHRDDVTVCDVRSYLDGRVGRDAYLDAHLPGARFVDLATVLASPAGPGVGRHPMPTPEVFAAGLGAEGIGDDTVVIAYDDLGGMIAGRLVWMLRIIGRPAALLDGGPATWPEPLESGPALPVTSVERTVVPWPPDATLSADEVVAHIEAGGTVVDSRAADRYRGEIEPIDAKAGHVPGAINLPFAGNLADGRFRPVAELRERFADAGIGEDAVFYCGSGVSACHNVLTAELLGLGRPRVYVGSWSGWSSEPDRPVATG